MECVEESEHGTLNIKRSSDCHRSENEEFLEILFLDATECTVLAKETAHNRLCSDNFNASIVEQLSECTCIVICVTMRDDDRVDEHTWNAHFSEELRAEWRWVNHDAFAVNPDNEPCCGSFRIESVR